MTNLVSYLALDPGETTGWATFDADGDIIEFGQVTQNQLQDFLIKTLTTNSLITVICEEYRNYSWQKQKKWSRNQTSKNEGMIEMACKIHNVPVVLQPAHIKSIGYKWAGLEPPSHHDISHQFDAYVHGVYWLQLNGIRPIGKALYSKESE